MKLLYLLILGLFALFAVASTNLVFAESINLTSANQSVLNSAISNEGFAGLLVSNVSVPTPDFSITPMLNYSTAQTILLNLTAAASDAAIGYGGLYCPHSLQNPNCISFLNVTNITRILPYGIIPSGDAYVAAGQSAYYLGVDNATGQVSVYNVSVIQAQPNMCVSIGNDTVCGAGTHDITVPDATVSPVLYSNLIAGNKLDFTYSVTRGATLLYSAAHPRWATIPSSQP